MRRSVRLTNPGRETVRLGQSQPVGSVDRFDIPPMGFAVMSQAQYVRVAINDDLSSLGLRVEMRDDGVRVSSVKDYGARGDGVTNDTASIQTAIDTAAARGGGVIEVPIGVYMVDGLLIDGDVELRGESSLYSVLKLRSGARTPVVAVASSSAKLTRLRLMGNGER